MKVNHLQKHLEQQKRASVDEGVDNWGTLLHCSSAGKESTCNVGDLGSILGLGRSAGYPLQHSWASLVAQLIKNPPAMRETWVQSLLEETQAGIKISRRNINNLRYADDTTLMAESEEELKSL